MEQAQGLGETKPICPPSSSRDARRQDLRQTKPIPVRAAPGKGRQTWQCRRRDPSCRTKPICSAPTGKDAGGPALPPLGTSVRNKANFRSSGRRDGAGTDNCERSAAIRPRMPGAPAGSAQGNCMWPRRSSGYARVAGILPAIRGRSRPRHLRSEVTCNCPEDQLQPLDGTGAGRNTT